MKSLLALILSITLVAYAADVIAGEDWKGKIYWTLWGENKIAQSNFDCSNKMFFVRTNKYPQALVVDEKNGLMYWGNAGQFRTNDLKGSIQRCQMDDCPNTTITIVEPGKIAKPMQLTLDRIKGYIYWSDSGRDLIHRSKLDGSNLETVLVLIDERELPVAPIGCEIDEENGILYWSESSANRIGRIKLANIKLPYTPKGSDYVVTEGLNFPYRIKIDKSRHKLFIAERYAQRISWVSLDGGIPNEIVNIKSTHPVGVALDRKAGKIFFSGLYPHEIHSINMDGTGLKKICDNSGSYPTGMFFVPKTE